jgi:PAS domain S-box-containing protein
MRITTKLTLIISLLMITLFLALGWNSYRHDQIMIRQHTVDKARTIARQIIETREYLSNSTKISEIQQNYNLTPQVAASRIARELTENTPYYVRQVSLRYRNPLNKPDQYELEELKKLAGGEYRESHRVVETNGQKSLRYMLPMKAEASCLACHGSFESAPEFVRKRFPKGHPSYDYKAGQIIGAISVSVPMRELYNAIQGNLFQEMLYAGLIMIILVIVTGWSINHFILAPVTSVAEGISTATTSGDFASRIATSRTDEVGRLVTSFNELMAELERRTRQRAESDERYRNFIEIAQSPIITFLPDGKIVIANQKAEKLFGMTREELIGQSVFDFMSDPASMQQGISDYFTAGSSSMFGTTSRQTVRDICGRVFDVDMVISVSQTDHEAMFTAILRTVTANQ